jgi:hypothetical protein
MSRSTRIPVVGLLVGLALLALSLGLLTFVWYEPIPRTWWSLALYVLGYGLAIVGGFFIGGFLRRVRRKIVTGRAARDADGP